MTEQPTNGPIEESKAQDAKTTLEQLQPKMRTPGEETKNMVKNPSKTNPFRYSKRSNEL